MRMLLIVAVVILTVMAIIARVMIRCKKDEHWFVHATYTLGTVLSVIGTILVLEANMGAMNQFAMYEPGFPNGDTGGLPLITFLTNLAIFCLPLLVLGPRWLIRRALQDSLIIPKSAQ